MQHARYEHNVKRRPFLLNSVLLRQNPNNITEWHKRVALFRNKEPMEASLRNTGYVLISPCRNEAELVRRTLDWVLAQASLGMTKVYRVECFEAIGGQG